MSKDEYSRKNVSTKIRSTPCPPPSFLTLLPICLYIGLPTFGLTSSCTFATPSPIIYITMSHHRLNDSEPSTGAKNASIKRWNMDHSRYGAPPPPASIVGTSSQPRDLSTSDRRRSTTSHSVQADQSNQLVKYQPRREPSRTSTQSTRTVPQTATTTTRRPTSSRRPSSSYDVGQQPTRSSHAYRSAQQTPQVIFEKLNGSRSEMKPIFVRRSDGTVERIYEIPSGSSSRRL